MADFNELENKLADWFKYVDRQAEAVKHGGVIQPPKEDEPKEIVSKTPVPEAPESVKKLEGQDEVVVERPKTSDQQRITSSDLFKEPDIPEIEDFLPFLKDSRPEEKKPVVEDKPQPPQRPVPPPAEPKMSAAPPVPPVEQKPPIIPQTPKVDPIQPKLDDQSTLSFSEGTGIPRPRPKVEETPVEQVAQPPVVQEPQKPQQPEQPEPPKQQVLPTPPPEEEVQPTKPPVIASVASDTVKDAWQQLPKHIKLLLGSEKREVSQASYKEFKETRQELIQRLLDPSLSLEEAARILNVCPTTVRRYTNRGVLPHFRTAGNQRRFRLSDVLAFLERQSRNVPEA